jgi:hypothetical protein
MSFVKPEELLTREEVSSAITSYQEMVENLRSHDLLGRLNLNRRIEELFSRLEQLGEKNTHNRNEESSDRA